MTRKELIQSPASRKLRAEVHRLTKGKKGIPLEEAREKAICTLTERRTGKPASGPPKTGRVSKTSDKTPTEDSFRRTDARMYLFRNHLPSEIQDPTYAGPGSREEKVAGEGTRSNVKKLGVKSELDMTPKGKRSERIATWKSAAETASKAPKKYATTLGVAKEAQKAGDTSSRAKKAIRAVHTVRRGVAINEAISMARAKGRSSKADEAEGKRFWPTYESGSQEDPNTKTKRENAKKPTRLMRVGGDKPASSTPPRRGKEESEGKRSWPTLEDYKRGHLGIPSEAEVDRIADRLGGKKYPLTLAVEKAKAARAKKEETESSASAKPTRAKKEETESSASAKPTSAAKALRVAVARRSLKGAKTGSGTWPAKKLSPLPPSPRVTFRQPKAPEDLPVAGKLRKVVKRVGKDRFIDATANERHGPSWVNPEHANAPARLERTHPRLAGMPHRSGIGHLFPEDALDRSLEAGHLDKILEKGEDRSRSGVSHATVGKVDLRYGRDAPNPKEGNPEFNPEGKKFDRTDSKAAELVRRAAKWKLAPNRTLKGAKGKWPASRPGSSTPVAEKSSASMP